MPRTFTPPLPNAPPFLGVAYTTDTSAAYRSMVVTATFLAALKGKPGAAARNQRVQELRSFLRALAAPTDERGLGAEVGKAAWAVWTAIWEEVGADAPVPSEAVN